VEFQSIKFDGSFASNATFGVPILSTGAQGEIATSLVAGATYHVRVTPNAGDAMATADMAITETDVIVPPLTDEQKQRGDACFCGHTIEVTRKRTAIGGVVTPSGAPFTEAEVSFEPSQSGDRSYWERIHAPDPILPRPASVTSDAAGIFKALVDPGFLDVIVRPSVGSSFPWFVRPRVEVKATDTSVNLGDLKVPQPVILEGKLTDPEGAPVASAYVDVWLPVSTNTNTSTSTGGGGAGGGTGGGATQAVVQIAATTTDASGYYHFVLPPTVAR